MQTAEAIRRMRMLYNELAGEDIKSLDGHPWGTMAEYSKSSPVSYRGSHQAPGRNDGWGSLDSMTRTYPDDLYSEEGWRGSMVMVGTWIEKIHGIIRAYRNLPRALVEVYRAVPADVDGEILPGELGDAG